MNTTAIPDHRSEKTFPIIPVLLIAIAIYFPLYEGVRHYLVQRPAQEKMGYMPQREIMRILALDHKPFISEWLFLKTIVYYGGLIEKGQNRIDYKGMYRFLDVSTYIDPYNIDSYYVTQALFPWDGFVRETNDLLKRGINYRTWDHYIPFFLAFNNFYFLKDYKEASRYMAMAGRIKKEQLLINLAARLLYESNDTEIAVTFLKEMIEKTWNKGVRESLQKRLDALERILYLEKAIGRFETANSRKPKDLKELLNKGFIERIPEDPYGGEFYIDKDGRVRTTSRLISRRHK